MKPTITILMLLITFSALSQIHVTYDPISAQSGFLVNQEIHKVGVFAKYSYKSTIQDTYAFDYSSYSYGISLKFDEFSLLAGYTRNYLDVFRDDDISFIPDKIHLRSFSVGFIADVNRYLSVSALTDVLNLQTQVGFGIKLW